MSIEFDTSGLKDIKNTLDKYAQKADELDGKQVSYADLFPEDFMSEFTKFSGLKDFFDAGGFHITNGNEITSLPKSKLDAYVATATPFKSWKEMMNKATSDYIIRQVNLD